MPPRQQHRGGNAASEQHPFHAAGDDLADAAKAILAKQRGAVTIVLASVWLISAALFSGVREPKAR